MVNYNTSSAPANTPVPANVNATGFIAAIDKNATLYLIVVASINIKTLK